MKKYFIIFLTMTCFKAGAQSISGLEKDMNGIATDATEGRFTGSAGYLKAAKYIVKELKAYGIRPVWKENNKTTYFQSVPFTWDDYTGSTLTIDGKNHVYNAKNFIVINRGVVKSGKWLVLSTGDSVVGSPAGIILIPNRNQSGDWETTVISQYRFGYMHYVPDGVKVNSGIPTIVVSPTLAKNLHIGDSVTVKLQYKQIAKTGYNIIGMVEGNEVKKSHRTLIVSSHLDHIGRIGNHIYNGANDDASGCVAALCVAKMLRTKRVNQSVIFVFFCGEELNLKGSDWFADHLPVAQTDISAVLNFEQLGSKHRALSGLWALGDTVFKDVYYQSAGSYGNAYLHFSAKDTVNEILRNTDTYSLMNKQIPSLLLGSGGFPEHHTTLDNIDLIDFKQMQTATSLIFDLIERIGSK